MTRLFGLFGGKPLKDPTLIGVAVKWNAYVPTLATVAREHPWLDLRIYSYWQVGKTQKFWTRP
jgi:hypothetical protein